MSFISDNPCPDCGAEIKGDTTKVIDRNYSYSAQEHADNDYYYKTIGYFYACTKCDYKTDVLKRRKDSQDAHLHNCVKERKVFSPPIEIDPNISLKQYCVERVLTYWSSFGISRSIFDIIADSNELFLFLKKGTNDGNTST